MKRLLFFLFLTLFSKTIFAWGHSKSLSQRRYFQASLSYAAIDRQAIRYCVESEDPEHFPIESLSIQIEFSLRLWLSAAAPNRSVGIEKANCQDENLDLVVELMSDRSMRKFAAFEEAVEVNGKLLPRIVLNRAFTYKIEDSKYGIIDFADILPMTREVRALPKLEALKATLEQVGIQEPMTVNDYADNYNFGDLSEIIVSSSYPAILHEIGHAFGLCDTAEAQMETQCDPKFRSRESEEGVMYGGDYLYLSPDDRAGIRTLFDRIRSRSRKSSSCNKRLSRRVEELI